MCRYIAIDLKSFYASVECVARGMDPLKANLLVVDPSRSDKTIVLAVSPALKAVGVPARPRLFEAKRAIRQAEYIRVSSRIYGIYLRFVAPEDIHVYSIDECFIDAGSYARMYGGGNGAGSAHALAASLA